ncbi:hypothetical protein KDU71_08545 [Carboxylicivirga sediminis]|uniref:Two component regulator three Y domain-containing protein n=1 Tax=Carboxylicivirga sediminis TaxID=2006564 RepID=A0A941IXN8_9BACT|nr:triple tyrosine motif-containing protein [Carboxylicivirga sediminis]MBR8535604.1 hypothetical protein [Carboxylicivirga sediminis]
MTRIVIIFLYLLYSINSIATDIIKPSTQRFIITPRISSFTKHDYNAENQNWSVCSSEIGAVYFANSMGLLRFDGENWNLYETPNVLRAVYCSGDTIYVGGNGIMGYFLESNLNAGYHALATIYNDIWKIFASDKYVIFQAFNRMYHLNEHGHIGIERIEEGNTTFAYPIDNEIFYQLSHGKLIALTPNAKERTLLNSPALNKYMIKYISKTVHNEYLLGTLNNGLFQLKDGRLTRLPSALNDFLIKYQLNKAIYLYDGYYAFASMNGGVIIGNLEGEIKYIFDNSNGLSSNRIHGLHHQNDGQLWIASDNGIAFVDLKSPFLYFNYKNNPLGTYYDALSYNGNYYIATNKGVYVARPDTFHTNIFDIELVKNSEGQAWNLDVIDKELFVGHNNGTFQLVDEQLTKIADVAGGYHFLQSDIDSSIMYETSYYGLAVYTRQQGKWQFDFNINNMEGLTHDVIEQNDGSLIVTGSLKEAYHITIDHNSKKVQIEDISKHAAFNSSNWIRAFNLDHQTYLVASDTTLQFKEGQLIPAHKALDKISYISEAIGNYCFIRKKGALELFNFKKNELVEIPYNLTHIENELVYKYENITKIKEHECFFCLSEGIAYTNIENLTTAKYKQKPTLITNIEYSNNRTGEVGQHDTIQSAVPHIYNTVKFTFTALNYESDAIYEFYLDGYSQNWQRITSSNEVVFQDLREGQYTFKVKQKGSSLYAKHTFKIAPPYYRTIYAYFVYGLLIVSLYIISISLYRHFIRKQTYKQLIAKRKKLHEQNMELKQKQLDEEVKELQSEVTLKNDKLSNLLLQNSKKKEIIDSIQQELQQIRQNEKYVSSRHIDRLTRMIKSNFNEQKDWLMFEAAFSEANNHFFKKLREKHPILTDEDLKLCAYLKVNMSSKELAPIFQITTRSVDLKKYRLKKKLGLSREQGLNHYLQIF